MSVPNTAASEKKGLFSPDLDVLEKLTGLTISPPSCPDWGIVYNQDIKDKCRILALIIQLQQTAANQLKEELRTQEQYIRNLTALEIKLLNERETKIKPEDVSASADNLYELAKQIGITDVYDILDSLSAAGLIEDSYHYEASSIPKKTGYKIRESKLQIAYDLVNKWGQNADKQ